MSLFTKTGLKRGVMIAALAALLVGCGAPAVTPTAAPKAAEPTQAPEATKAPEPTAVPEATQAPEPTAVPEATKAPEVAAPQLPGLNPVADRKMYKGQVVLSTNGANPDRGVFKGLVAAYKQVQPDVEVIVEGPPTGVGYPEWLGTQLAAGNIRPDVVSGNYQATYAKYVNLDKFRFQTNPYTSRPWDEDLDWNFFQEKNVRGEKVMIPTEAVHILWFYNKDIFDKAGVQPPTTWDELAAACEKIEAAVNIKCVGANYIWKLNQWILEIYWDQYARDNIDIAKAQPGDYNYDEQLDGKFKFDPTDVFMEGKYNKNFSRFYAAIRDGKIKFDTPEMADLVAQLAKVFPKHASDSLFVDSTEYSQFLQQQVAVIIDGTWSLGGMTRDMASLTNLTAERAKALGISETVKLQPFQWSTFENPAMVGPLVKYPNVRSIESATGIYLSIVDKTAEQTEMVLDFIMFATSQPGYQSYVDGAMTDPLSPDGYSPSGPIMVNGVKAPEKYQTLMDNVKMMGNVENGLFLPQRLSAIESVDKQAMNDMKDALEGKITPEEYAKRLQKLWTDNFDALMTKAGLTKDDLDNPGRDPSAK